MKTPIEQDNGWKLYPGEEMKFPSMDKKVPKLIKEIRKNLKKEGKKIKKWYYDANKKLKIEVEAI